MRDLPPRWASAPLAAVIASSVGGMWGSADGSDGATRVRVIRGAEFREWTKSRAHSAPQRFVPDSGLTSRRLEIGDVVLEVSGGGPTQPVGRTVLIDEQTMLLSDLPLICSNFCRRLVLSDHVDPRFVWYQLDHLYVLRDTDQYQRATTNIRNLQVPHYLEGTKLVIPPEAEQKRIVAAIEQQLSRLDAGVSALEDARQNLKRMRVAVLAAAVAAGDAATDDRVRLGDVLREPLRNGYSAKADCGGRVRIWTLSAVTNCDFGLHNSKLTAADPNRVRTLWVQPGDLLIERSNTRQLVGSACLYTGQPDVAVYPDLVIRARVSESVLPRFVELMLQAPPGRRYFQRRAQGISGSMPKIDQAAIEAFSFPLPALKIQAEIIEWVGSQQGLISTLERLLAATSTRCARLRSSVLTAAFSGKLVPQDPNDEPASVLLERIAGERASSNGHKIARGRNQRTTRRKVPA